MGTVIYGSELSRELREEMKREVDSIRRTGGRIPRLDVILVGEDPASLSYVRGKNKACESIGIKNVQHHLSANASQEEVESAIEACNQDPNVDGILLQLPLPKGLDAAQAVRKIDPMKDVDGLHPYNTGKFYTGQPGFIPCTPLGVMELLKKMECDIDGKRAVVIGRSHLVGSPVARLLQNANATVTICHSHTRNIREICKEADILIAAVGNPKFVDHTYVKEGAYVVDVGINRTEDGKLVGDVDFDDVIDHVAAITPVPKGVGPMTICMLLRNTLRSYKEKTDV